MQVTQYLTLTLFVIGERDHAETSDKLLGKHGKPVRHERALKLTFRHEHEDPLAGEPAGSRMHSIPSVHMVDRDPSLEARCLDLGKPNRALRVRKLLASAKQTRHTVISMLLKVSKIK